MAIGETEKPRVSPRIEALKREIESGNTDALAHFWAQVEREGTPLFEPPAGSPDKSWVTFLWRDREPVENVAVIGEVMDFDPGGNVMVRIPATDVMFKSYLWRSDLLTCYELSPNDPLSPAVMDDTWDERTRTWQTDPLNPERYRVNIKDEEDLRSKEKYLSVLRLPGAPPQPWAQPRPEGLAGRLEMRRMHSKTMNDQRRVWIYTPPGYAQSGEACALLVMTDGIPYTQIMAAPTTMDNLILAGKIRPTVGVFVDNPDRGSDLSCNPDFARYLAEELVPAIQNEFNVTHDPAGTVIGGTSLGGLNAVYVALGHSDVFGAVLSNSGAFQFPWDENEEPEGLARAFVHANTGPIVFYMDVGMHELGAWNHGPSILISNRHLRDVLRARGYTVHYKEFNGGHNYICWQGTLADGLLALLGPGKAAS